ncbi:plant PDR ABC transporter associated protein, partial [Tanacetum coccineum]
TFARVSGYCEQNDVHSPNVTVSESLLYFAWLCLSSNVDTKTLKIFVDELMELVKLHPLRNAMGGIPGVDGLTIEQQKRLTIAVELVANPSIIFMDEPISGLDARAATIVMRTFYVALANHSPRYHTPRQKLATAFTSFISPFK